MMGSLSRSASATRSGADGSPENGGGALSRRSILGKGAKLAFAAPAVLAALQAGAAFADESDDERRGRGRSERDDSPAASSSPPRRRPDVPAAFRLELCRVADVPANDFTSANPGTDPLRDGRLRIAHDGDAPEDGRVRVRLRRAKPASRYQVFFVRFKDQGREDLGVVGPTDEEGDLDAAAPTPLSGANRVGIFVLVRQDGDEAGKDEFVTCVRRPGAA